MKAKIRGTKKDINIDIKIENNLLSKNKIKPSNDEKETEQELKKTARPGSSVAPNSNMSRLLSEYYGVMAQRELYRQTQSPFSLQQIINPTAQNQGESPQSAGGSNTQQGQQDDDVEDTEYEEQFLNASFVAAGDDENGEGAAGDGNDPPSTQPSAIEITPAMLEKSILDNPDEEKEFVNSHSIEWQERRKELIHAIMNSPRMYLKKIDIITFKLGRYVQLYASKKWERLMGGKKNRPPLV